MAAPADGEDIICCVQDVHVRELVARMEWVVRTRWLFVAATLGVALLALAGALGASLDGRLFLLAAGLMLAANLWFVARARRIDARCAGTHELRVDSFLQMAADYLALAVVVYALGSVETPIMFMVLPNIILAALFFTRLQSLLISLMGLVCVSLPLIFEAWGWLPVVSIYGGSVKAHMLAQPVVLFDFLLLLGACVLFSWYLVSHITASLIRNELELEDNYQTMLRLDAEKTQATLRGTHELKAPLAAIKSYCYALRDGYAGPLPEKAQAVVQKMAARCDRLLGKITDIIRLGNLKTYVVTGESFRTLDALAVLVREVEEARQIGHTRQVSVEYVGPAGGGPVRASDEHLRTIFSNLLSNAVNYSHAGGTVQVVASLTDRQVVVGIQDQGIGIGPADMPHVFEEHYRATNAAAHHEGGTGLGLPIVKATAKLLGAGLDVRSEVGRGTRFTISLPRSDQPEGE